MSLVTQQLIVTLLIHASPMYLYNIPNNIKDNIIIVINTALTLYDSLQDRMWSHTLSTQTNNITNKMSSAAW